MHHAHWRHCDRDCLLRLQICTAGPAAPSSPCPAEDPHPRLPTLLCCHQSAACHDPVTRFQTAPTVRHDISAHTDTVQTPAPKFETAPASRHDTCAANCRCCGQCSRLSTMRGTVQVVGLRGLRVAVCVNGIVQSGRLRHIVSGFLDPTP
jgi:hypothetical protein